MLTPDNSASSEQSTAGDTIHGDKVQGDKVQGDKHVIEGPHLSGPIGSDRDTIIGTIVNVTYGSAAQPQTAARANYYYHTTLPDHYVPRPDLLAQVQDALLNSRASIAIPGQASKVVALHGMPGIGKTVLARAICSLPIVQAMFPDGILWASIGQQADLVPTLRGWVQVLGGIVPEMVPSVDSLKAILANLLADRACLLVADDIRSSRQLALFQIASPRSCLLLTTWDSALAEKVNAHVVPVPAMAAAESMALLSRWSAGALKDDALAAQIVERLGHLPLAIKLAGAQLRRYPADQWLRTFDVTKLRDRRPAVPHDNLSLTFDLSLDILRNDERARYLALAIFQTGEPTPAHVIARLWQAHGDMQADDVDELLGDLKARALVDLTSLHEQSMVSLHTLLHAWNAAKLGRDGQRVLHRHLLDTYRAAKQERGWNTILDDGYLRRHLVWHLEQAELHDELHALFREETPDGRNAWFEARDLLGETDGFLNDLQRATTCAAQAFPDQPQNVVLQWRYTLLASTISGLARNIPGPLLAKLVEHNNMPAMQALTYARQVDDLRLRAAMLRSIASLLDPPLNDVAHLEVTAALRALDEDRRRPVQSPSVRARRKKRQHILKQAQQYVGSGNEVHALELIAGLDDQNLRAELLAALAPHLSESSIAQALEMTRGLRYADARATAIAGLAVVLPPTLLIRALGATRLIADDWAQEEALIRAAPYVSPQMRRRILERLWPAPRYRTLAAALSEIAPQLEAALQHEVLARVQALDDAASRQAALAALAPRFPEAEHAMLEELRLMAQPQVRRRAILRMAAFLPVSVRDEALGVIRRLGNSEERAKHLLRLAPQLPEHYLNEVFQIACSIGDAVTRAKAVVSLIRILSNSTPTARQATQEICNTFGWRDWHKLRSVDIPRMSQQLLVALVHRHAAWLTRDQALQLVRQLPDTLLITTLAELACYFPLGLVYDVLGEQQHSSELNPDIGAAVLVRLGALGHYEEALERIHSGPPDTMRVNALETLARDVPLPLLDEVVTIARSWQADARVVVMLAALPRLTYKPRDELHRFYTGTLALLATRPRRDVLVGVASLAPIMKELGGQATLDEALMALEAVCHWFP